MRMEPIARLVQRPIWKANVARYSVSEAKPTTARRRRSKETAERIRLTLKDNFRKHLADSGMTIEDLHARVAEMFGHAPRVVSFDTLKRWHGDGSSQPDRVYLDQVAAVFGIKDGRVLLRPASEQTEEKPSVPSPLIREFTTEIQPIANMALQASPDEVLEVCRRNSENDLFAYMAFWFDEQKRRQVSKRQSQNGS